MRGDRRARAGDRDPPWLAEPVRRRRPDCRSSSRISSIDPTLIGGRRRRRRRWYHSQPSPRIRRRAPRVRAVPARGGGARCGRARQRGVAARPARRRTRESRCSSRTTGPSSRRGTATASRSSDRARAGGRRRDARRAPASTTSRTSISHAATSRRATTRRLPTTRPAKPARQVPKAARGADHGARSGARLRGDAGLVEALDHMSDRWHDKTTVMTPVAARVGRDRDRSVRAGGRDAARPLGALLPQVRGKGVALYTTDGKLEVKAIQLLDDGRSIRVASSKAPTGAQARVLTATTDTLAIADGLTLYDLVQLGNGRHPRRQGVDDAEGARRSRGVRSAARAGRADDAAYLAAAHAQLKRLANFVDLTTTRRVLQRQGVRGERGRADERCDAPAPRRVARVPAGRRGRARDDARAARRAAERGGHVARGEGEARREVAAAS